MYALLYCEASDNANLTNYDTQSVDTEISTLSMLTLQLMLIKLYEFNGMKLIWYPVTSLFPLYLWAFE